MPRGLVWGLTGGDVRLARVVRRARTGREKITPSPLRRSAPLFWALCTHRDGTAPHRGNGAPHLYGGNPDFSRYALTFSAERGSFQPLTFTAECPAFQERPLLIGAKQRPIEETEPSPLRRSARLFGPKKTKPSPLGDNAPLFRGGETTPSPLGGCTPLLDSHPRHT